MKLAMTAYHSLCEPGVNLESKWELIVDVEWYLIKSVAIDGTMSEQFKVVLVEGDERLDYAVLALSDNNKIFDNGMKLRDVNIEMKTPFEISQNVKIFFYKHELNLTIHRPIQLPERMTTELRQVFPFVTKDGKLTKGKHAYCGGTIELGNGNCKGASGAPILDETYEVIAVLGGSYNDAGEASDNIKIAIKSNSENSAACCYARIVYNIKILRDFIENFVSVN